MRIVIREGEVLRSEGEDVGHRLIECYRGEWPQLPLEHLINIAHARNRILDLVFVDVSIKDKMNELSHPVTEHLSEHHAEGGVVREIEDHSHWHVARTLDMHHVKLLGTRIELKLNHRAVTWSHNHLPGTRLATQIVAGHPCREYMRPRGGK